MTVSWQGLYVSSVKHEHRHASQPRQTTDTPYTSEWAAAASLAYEIICVVEQRVGNTVHDLVVEPLLSNNQRMRFCDDKLDAYRAAILPSPGSPSVPPPRIFDGSSFQQHVLALFSQSIGLR